MLRIGIEFYKNPTHLNLTLKSRLAFQIIFAVLFFIILGQPDSKDDKSK